MWPEAPLQVAPLWGHVLCGRALWSLGKGCGESGAASKPPTRGARLSAGRQRPVSTAAAPGSWPHFSRVSVVIAGAARGQSHALCLEGGPSHRGGGGTQPLARGHCGPTAAEKGADPNFLRTCSFAWKVAQKLWVSSKHWTDTPDATDALVGPGASGSPLPASPVLPTALPSREQLPQDEATLLVSGASSKPRQFWCPVTAWPNVSTWPLRVDGPWGCPAVPPQV